MDSVVHTWVNDGLLVPNPNFKYVQAMFLVWFRAVFETLHRTAASSNLQLGEEADDVISIPKG